MSNYNFSLTTFSSTGKLTQIEYALSAVSQGVTSIGLKGKKVVSGKLQLLNAASLFSQEW
jgi:20S proteasome subunit alpha 2